MDTKTSVTSNIFNFHIAQAYQILELYYTLMLGVNIIISLTLIKFDQIINLIIVSVKTAFLANRSKQCRQRPKHLKVTGNA